MGYKGSDLAKIIALTIVYLVTARFGLSQSAVGGFATLIWLPSGISLAALLIFGFKLWPGILLGALLANLLTGAPFLAALGIGIGNTLEACLGAFFLEKFTHLRRYFDRLKDVLGLVIVATVSTLVSAAIGVISLYTSGTLASNQLIPTWIAWWTGDMISDLVVAPLILVWSNKWIINFKLNKIFEALIFTLILILIYLIVFIDILKLPVDIRPSAYMIFPPLIWMAVRFGQTGAVMVIFILSVFSTLATLQGLGPFAEGSITENLLSQQIFMAVVSITALILASVIAERKKFEQQKDEFISIAAHELKTPVTTIKGYLQLLERHLYVEKDKKALNYILSIMPQINNLTRLISDFFDVSKIQAEKLELQKEKIKLDDLIKEVVIDMKPSLDKHEIKVKGRTNSFVLADKYRIIQVLTNLIGNAIKFSPKAKIINIYLSYDKLNVKVDVEDFGIGISRRDMSNIFERFFQANTNIRPSASGLGLGLYISSVIIKHHGGKIWAKSQKGEGTTISFSLPKVNI